MIHNEDHPERKGEPVAERCEHGEVVRSVRRGRRSAAARLACRRSVMFVFTGSRPFRSHHLAVFRSFLLVG
ncbi:hypothetical protein [uncultured Methanoregula sp.]|uniref:hypothetical protein n=1 Tax=uncultured Methanoregula sp. TaxID=1005933 RepID=UPI002AAB3E04|nr:hypothetical protein [uncultured Methanoregula sp.]